MLFLNASGLITGHQKISDMEGGLSPGLLDDFDFFGSSLAVLPDINSNGIVELAVEAEDDYDDAAAMID